MTRIKYNPIHFILAVVLGCLLAVTLQAASFRNGTRSCPSSGAQALSATSIKAGWIVIQSPQSPVANTGRVHLGGSGVTTSTANYLLPGDTYNFPTAGNAAVYDLSQIYFACTVSSDLVTYSYLQ